MSKILPIGTKIRVSGLVSIHYENTPTLTESNRWVHKTGEQKILEKFPFDQPVIGYITGVTYKQTGTYRAAHISYSFDGEPVYEEAYLSNTKTHKIILFRVHPRQKECFCLEEQMEVIGE